MRLEIAKDFSKETGIRYRSESDFSGEEFREDLLLPKFNEAVQLEEKLVVVLDGVRGYASSFLEEAFGGLAREVGVESVQDNLEIISEQESYLIEEIMNYIRYAND